MTTKLEAIIRESNETHIRNLAMEYALLILGSNPRPQEAELKLQELVAFAMEMRSVQDNS